jgi:hypothetical protein
MPGYTLSATTLDQQGNRHVHGSAAHQHPGLAACELLSRQFIRRGVHRHWGLGVEAVTALPAAFSQHEQIS